MSTQSAKLSACRDLTHTTSARSSVYPSAKSLWRLFGTALSMMRQRHYLRRLEHDLMAMPDFMLKDIGITRSEVSAAVNGHLERYRKSI